MNTPIYNFVNSYLSSSPLRLHMPGHKGEGPLGFEKYDITEIEGADVLYCADGIIRESMDNAASIFGTAKTVYSTEGSSLCIRAMLYLLCMYAKANGKKPAILAGRNAHKVFIMTAGLLDIEVKWLYDDPKGSLCACNISAQSLDNTLLNMAEKPTCVYITSPDYLGNIADIASLSAVCKKHGVLLFVDNAHGAYLKFLEGKNHPTELFADLCCDSAHKTLSCLTGAAYLHVSRTAPVFFAENAEKAMSVFASTSPSYLILQSLDLQNKLLSENFSQRLSSFCERTAQLKKEISALGYTLLPSEPLKITLASKSYGYKGFELSAALSEKGVYAEFSDPDFLVLMLTPNCPDDLESRLLRVLRKIPPRPEITEPIPEMPVLERCTSIKDALMTPGHLLPVEECVGKYLTVPTASCPPAVPIAICGEVISEQAVQVFKYYSQNYIKVND